MGDLRSSYRFLAPALVAAGYRVAGTDLRGHGDSDTSFTSYGDVDTAGDVAALIDELGGPAVIVGNSMGAGAAVLVESRAADVQTLLPSTPWQTEPQPYLRSNGCEIPYVTPQLQGASGRTGTWELLFQNAVGRYLQLRLTLSGNGRNTPRLQALRARVSRIFANTFRRFTRTIPSRLLFSIDT